jgi:uncharacterized membrane protein YfhO
VLPRAAIFHHAVLVSNEAEALNKLADPLLDIFQSVVLNEVALTQSQRKSVTAINHQHPIPVESAWIKSYRSQDVQIEASLKQAGILVLNDTSYPGWTATVDDQPAAWTNANYLFRGVFLPAGKHALRFRYQPESFRWGAAISLGALGLLAMGFCYRYFARRPSLLLARRTSNGTRI